MRRQREGEVVCGCGAYSFPHRLTGGRCTLQRWVRHFFEPLRRECSDCDARVGGEGGECEIVVGAERAPHCPELRAFIRYEGIRLYGAARAAFERSRCAA